MRPRFDVPILEGSLVRLEPLSVRHAEDLAAAAEEDRGSYDFTLVPGVSEVGGYLTAQFARTAQGLIPFAQIRQADGRAVGCTAYWDPRYWPGRDDLRAIEIGFTWLAASAQGSGINTEAKLLLSPQRGTATRDPWQRTRARPGHRRNRHPDPGRD